MIELRVTIPGLGIQTSAQIARDYRHALVGAPDEPIAAILDHLDRPDVARVEVITEAGNEGTLAVIRRGPRMVPQLSVADNLMMAFIVRGETTEEATDRTHDLLVGLGMLDCADAHPEALSLGELRLIAAARDLIEDADLVFLDDLGEGLSGTDRARVIDWVERYVADSASALVIHSAQPVWAIGQADRVMVIDQGKVAQHDTIHGVIRKPVSQWVTDHLPNVYRGQLQNGVIAMADGRKVHTHEMSQTGPVIATVHPRSVLLHRERPEGSASNVFYGKVAGLEPAGERVRVNLLGLTPIVAEVTVGSCRRLDLPVGGPIWASFKASRVDTYPLSFG